MEPARFFLGGQGRRTLRTENPDTNPALGAHEQPIDPGFPDRDGLRGDTRRRQGRADGGLDLGEDPVTDVGQLEARRLHFSPDGVGDFQAQVFLGDPGLELGTDLVGELEFGADQQPVPMQRAKIREAFPAFEPRM